MREKTQKTLFHLLKTIPRGLEILTPFDLRQWPHFSSSGGNPSCTPLIDQITTDSRVILSPRSLFVALPGQFTHGYHFLKHAASMGARYALVEKSFNTCNLPDELQLLKVEHPLKAFQEIAKLYRSQMPAKVIAITGSYGKTLLKDLLTSILSQQFPTISSPESFNSQIGVPISLLTIQKEHAFALIEAGISQFGEMEELVQMIQADHAILTNIGPAHLSTLRSLEETAREKFAMIRHIPKTHWALIPHDPFLTPYLEETQGNLIFWDEDSPPLPRFHLISKNKEPYEETTFYSLQFDDGSTFQSSFPSSLTYFPDLIQMAVKAAFLLGCVPSSICNGLQNYTLEPMHTEVWRSQSGATIINESYCSHPLSMTPSLRYLQSAPKKGKKFFLFGGLRSNNSQPPPYKQMGERFAQSGLDELSLLGTENFTPLIDVIKKLSPQTRISTHQSCANALVNIKDRLRYGDTLLVRNSKKEPWEGLSDLLSEGSSFNKLFVNVASIRENIQSIRKSLPPKTLFMAMVKAQGYGTDAILLSQFLSQFHVDYLGLAHIEEAVSLRQAGINKNLFVINASSCECEKITKYSLEVAVNDASFIRALQEHAKNVHTQIPVHLHVDTGMSRLGCRPEEAIHLAQSIQNSSHLILKGIMTHFSSAENHKEDSFTLFQAKTFTRIIDDLKSLGIDPPLKHAANSSAALRFTFPQFNLVRIGLALFGILPFSPTKDTPPLRPALHLQTKVVGINTCLQGESISYGRTYRVQKPKETLAVLPLGYFDGLHQRYSGSNDLLIRGQPAKMRGTICMDFMMCDASNIRNVSVGDDVLIFGDNGRGQTLSAELFAKNAGVCAYELIACLGSRIQRIFIDKETPGNT